MILVDKDIKEEKMKFLLKIIMKKVYSQYHMIFISKKLLVKIIMIMKYHIA